MATPTVIQFNLLDNARDSLRQAVELLALDEIGSHHARLKHSITASAHCIELLLKERLRRINPAFVWENVDKYQDKHAREHSQLAFETWWGQLWGHVSKS